MMTTTDILLRSATDLVQLLRDGVISGRELLERSLARIEETNPALNAVVTLAPDRARREADLADEARADGRQLGPLHGLPVTIKDSIETEGIRTTSGHAGFSEHVPSADAPAVARLRAAGAIVFGKTNLPEMAADCQSYNNLFGTTNNPWDLSRTPGGSSGGAATAIATGMSALELGSDLGGSIRIPAHFCGVYGLKPSFGIVPLAGHIPPPPGALAPIDIAVLGPIARHPTDLDLALSVIAGPHRGTGWRLALPPARHDRIGDYRVGVWLDDPCCSVDADTKGLLGAAASALSDAGARVESADAVAPAVAGAHDLAQRLIAAAFSHAIPDDEYQRLAKVAASSSSLDHTPSTRYARNVTQTARDFNTALEMRAQLLAKWAEFFAEFDVLLCPATPAAAFPHDQSPDADARTITVDGRTRPYGDQFAWLQAIGVAHLPAVSAPLGFSQSGLPIGCQIVGPYLEDRTAIDLARRLGALFGGFVAPPIGPLQTQQTQQTHFQ